MHRRHHRPPHEAERFGLVNQVVPAAELAAAARAMADKVALVPPVTARHIKDSINHTVDLQGQRDSWQYHFMSHHFVHNTAAAQDLLAERQQAGLHEGGLRGPRPRRHAAPRATPHDRAARRACGSSTSAPASPRRSAPGCSARWAPRSSRSRSPRTGDFMREIGPFVDPATVGGADHPAGHSLFWSVEGRGRKGVTLDLRDPRARTCSAGWPPTADVVCENFRPGTLEKWDIGPGDLDPAPGRGAHLGVRPGRPQRPAARASTASASATAGCSTSPATRTGRRCAPASPLSDYLTGTFAAQAAIAALYRRDAGAEPAAADGEGAVVDACLYGSVLRILEWTIAGYDRLGIVRERAGNRLPNSAPLDNYPTADGRYVCIVAGSDANFARLCAAMDRPDLVDDPRFARLADRAAHGDEINGIVADWTRTPARRRDRGAGASPHDVPVATAYTAADIAADAHMAARGDLVTVHDSGHRPGAPAGALPPVRRRTGRRPRRAPPASASTTTRCGATWSA